MKKLLNALVAGLLTIMLLSSTVLATMYQGRKEIAATGTAVAIYGSSQVVDWVSLYAPRRNVGPVYVGSSGVTYTGLTTDGRPLLPGAVMALEACNLNNVYINGLDDDAVYFVASDESGVDLGAIAISVSNIDDNTDRLEGYVDGIEGTLTTIDTDTGNIAGYVDGLEGYVDGIEGTLTTIDTDTGNIAGYLDGVEGILTTMDVDTGNIATSVSTIAGDTTSLDGKILIGELTSTGLETGDAVVKASAGWLGGFIIITDGTNDATLVLYDDPDSADGTVLAKLVVAGGDNSGGVMFPFPVEATTGVYGDVSGTGANWIAYYQ